MDLPTLFCSSLVKCRLSQALNFKGFIFHYSKRERVEQMMAKMLKFLLFLTFIVGVYSRSLEERVKLLESRLDSLEEPGQDVLRNPLNHSSLSLFETGWNVLTKGRDSWRKCEICECHYLRRSIICWEKIGSPFELSRLAVPEDVETM